jgi:fructose-1-phosphate kinase PfkB-like protein
MLVGFVASLLEGKELLEAVRKGVAAGAANTLQICAGRFDRQKVEDLFWLIQNFSEGRQSYG